MQDSSAKQIREVTPIASLRTKVAEEIVAGRARKGYSQEQLAQLLGMTRNAISAIERKKRDVSVPEWMAFKKLLEIHSLEELQDNTVAQVIGNWEYRVQAIVTRQPKG